MLTATLAIAAFGLGAVPSLASAKGSYSGKVRSAAAMRQAAAQDRNAGTLGTAARRAVQRGYLVPNQAGYDRHKARISRRNAASQAITGPITGPVSGPLAPAIVSGKSWQGINNPQNAPPVESSAVGTTRYIELVNSNFAIYNKTSKTPTNQGTLNSLVGAASSTSVFDPQIIWDPTTNRFYYAADAVVSDTDNNLAFGFSTSASPSNANDWCKYVVPTGATFLDYPKLGDSQFFAIIGTNGFNTAGNFVGSNITALSKPKASDNCTTYGNTVKSGNNYISNTAFTPTPANEIDSNATGWAVARSNTNTATWNKLQLFKVTKAANGNPVIPATGTNVTVPSYTVPPNVPQKNSTNLIDSSDARNTQAVAGVDPKRGNKLALWTQHTVKGGAGAEVRWYEINPATHSLFQSGKVTSGAVFNFNGAISPNRRVNGATKSGGESMIMNFDASSTTTFPSILMVSKKNPGAQSTPVMVRKGTKPLSGFDCSRVAVTGSCRWGDYAAATPDPSTPNQIWQVSQFGNGAGSGTTGLATSRTWNFVAKP